MKETFTNFMAVLITLMIFSLWILPAYMIHITPVSDGLVSAWGILYIPVFILTCLWGSILHRKYFYNY